MEYVFTGHELYPGRIFFFYSMDVPLSVNEEVVIWCERERGGLGDPVPYGKARVVYTPMSPTGQYTGFVLLRNNTI